MVVDSSASIRLTNEPGGMDNWNMVLMFLDTVVSRMDISDYNVRVGLVVYSDVARNVFYLNTYRDKSAIRSVIYRIYFMNSTTNTSGAIRTAHKEQFSYIRGDRPNVMVSFYNGMLNYVPQSQVSFANLHLN